MLISLFIFTVLQNTCITIFLSVKSQQFKPISAFNTNVLFVKTHITTTCNVMHDLTKCLYLFYIKQAINIFLSYRKIKVFFHTAEARPHWRKVTDQ